MRAAARPLLAAVLVYAALYVAACIRYEHFFSLRVFVNFMEDNAALGVTAVGMTLVILAGGIDLSVGSVAALASIATALLIERHGWPPPLAVGAALGLCAGIGLATGRAVHGLRLAPFIVTLIVMFLARGLAYVLSVEPLPISDDRFARWGARLLRLPGGAGVSVLSLTLVAALAAASWASVQTGWGRCIYAIGGDEESARLMGLPVGRTKVLLYVVSAVCAGTGGVLLTIYQSAGNPSLGIGMELDAIAVVVIGGTLLTGGVGTVPGALVGLLIVATIQTAITFEGTLSSWWARVATGALLLAFVALQQVVLKLRR